MRILFLGTAAAEGYPGSFCTCRSCMRARELGGVNIRYRSSVLVDRRLLIDLPPDLYAASLRCGAELHDVRCVLVTHTHPDHFYPEELRLRCEPFAHGQLGPLVLAGSETAVEKARERLMGRGGVEYHVLTPGVEEEICGYRVLPLPAVHNTPGEEPLNYLVERGGRALLYALDTGPYGEEQFSMLRGRRATLVVADATMGLRPPGSSRYHMSIADVAALRERLIEEGVADPGTRFLLTHFSHNNSPPHVELVEALRGSGLAVAHDCMEVEA